MYPFTSWTDRAEHHEYLWRGLRIPYCTLGQGPPIVLLHGLGLSFQEWEKNIATMQRFGKIYALDLPGFGQSDKPEEILSCRQLAEVALSWAHDLDLAPGVWLGHSLGGEIALWAGALNPAQVRGIVLAGSTGLPPRPRLARRLLG
ncbi:MAG TPA: alpha/beta fold hydrolase, partial [Candidatus Obscuribacterales bacterium]